MTGIHTSATRKHWLYGLLAVCLLVFQTGNVVHDLDIAAHDEDSKCEICDLFVASNDDTDAIVATNTQVVCDAARFEFAAFAIASDSSRVNAPPIRAPPYFS